jgi:hypothetical protein
MPQPEGLLFNPIRRRRKKKMTMMGFSLFLHFNEISVE